MVVIIGLGTEVMGVEGVISVSWSLDPGLERLWEIGNYRPYDVFKRARQTLSITAYGRNPGQANTNPHWTLLPAGHPSAGDPCSTSNATWDISIYPAACSFVDNIENITDPVASRWYCDSYSYSKDDVMGYGQESWSFSRYIRLDDEPLPDVILQGISTGQIYAGNDVVSNLGVVLEGSPPYEAEGYDGSVSAGPASLGNMSKAYFGIVVAVGGGVGREDGKVGRANASIPHTPVWLGGS